MAQGDVEVNIIQPVAKKSAIFDGVDDYIDLGINFQLQKLSISFWFKPSTLINAVTEPTQVLLFTIADRAFVSFANDGNAHPGELAFGYYDGAFNYLYSTITSWPANEWVHVAVACDNVTGEKTLYINGVESVNTTDATDIQYHAARITAIASNHVPSNFFHGAIADVRIFNRALTAAEALEIYNNIKVSKGLISQYNFLDDTYDDSIGSTNGTNHGSRIGISDQAVAVSVAADRVTANDIYLMAETASKEVITAIIEEV